MKSAEEPKKKVRRHIASIIAGVAFASAALMLVAHMSEPTAIQVVSVDAEVDELLERYRTAASQQADEAVGELRALGPAGVHRLREIALDPAHEVRTRHLAIVLLEGNPEAIYDLLALVDDPNIDVSNSAQTSVRNCLALHKPRKPQSDTEDLLLRRWYEEHADSGLAIIALGPKTGAVPAIDTASSVAELFDAWSSGMMISAASPYCADLRAREGAAAEILRFAESDSPLRRSMAYYAVGLLGDSSVLPELHRRMAGQTYRADKPAIQIAIAQLTM